MGQSFNKIFSFAAREVKTYNVERRAEKIISQDKPTPAPKHPSTIKELERLKEENVSTEYLLKKDEQLHNILKKVYVTSPDPAPPLERKINPSRPLPVKRPSDMGITYGYSESEEAAVPEGRVTLKQALEFISNHQTDPKKYSTAAIASQYKLPPENTNDILEHFKLLAVKVQKKEVDPDSLSAYEQLQLKVKHLTAYNASALVKEVTAMYNKNDKKEDNKDKGEKLMVTKTPSTGGLEEANEKRNPEKATEIEKSFKKSDFERKPEEDITKASTIKRSQENG